MDTLTLKTLSRHRPVIRTSFKPILLVILPFLMLLFTLNMHSLSSGTTATQNTIMSSRLTTPRNHESQRTTGEMLETKFCDQAGSCIFDVGHNTGQDTEFYLRDPNSRVVAVEANPELVAASREKFAREIEEGRLKLISVGLRDGGEGREGKMKFWINENSKFSSFLERLGCRDGWGKAAEEGDHTFCKSVELETRTCRELVEEYGTPVYLKIDIEGMDKACVESVGEMEMNDRPKYLSVENVHEKRIRGLEGLGYDGFKAVNQLRLEVGVEENLKGYSGPWGEDAVDDERGKEWVGGDELTARLPLVRTEMVDGKERAVWYDLHARKGQVAAEE